MVEQFEKKSWFVVWLLSGITLGIYVPFWFKKIKKITDTNSHNEKLNNILIQVLLFSIIASILTNIQLTIGEKVISTNIFYSGTILRAVIFVLYLILVFNLRNILLVQFQDFKSNGFWAFIFGIMHLQNRINKLKEISPIIKNPVNSKIISPRRQELINYIKSNEAKGYTSQQLRSVLVNQGYSEEEINQDFKLAENK